jgi:hypothetical protein
MVRTRRKLGARGIGSSPPPRSSLITRFLHALTVKGSPNRPVVGRLRWRCAPACVLVACIQIATGAQKPGGEFCAPVLDLGVFCNWSNGDQLRAAIDARRWPKPGGRVLAIYGTSRKKSTVACHRHSVPSERWPVMSRLIVSGAC